MKKVYKNPKIFSKEDDDFSDKNIPVKNSIFSRGTITVSNRISTGHTIGVVVAVSIIFLILLSIGLYYIYEELDYRRAVRNSYIDFSTEVSRLQSEPNILFRRRPRRRVISLSPIPETINTKK